MEIKRMNMDLGNSLTSSIIDGKKDLVELPTAIVKVPSDKAEDYYTDAVDRNELIDSLLIEVNGTNYLIGKAATRKLGNDIHIGDELHGKSTSLIPYLMFLGTVAVYDAENNTQGDSEITINYFSTMLPVFELLEADKFSTRLNEMAKRFKGEHTVRVVTNGCRKNLKISVKESKCYAEGLTAKYAIQYKFDLTPNPSSEKFAMYDTINVDLGGGTIDMVHLPRGLKKPANRESFKTITDAPYLGMVKSLREGALRKYFKTSRELETFIVDNYESGSFVWVNGKTGEKVDLTPEINAALRDYTEQVMEIVLNAYPRLEQGKFYKYNYFGGVAPILRNEIKSYLREKLSVDIANDYHHIEPDHTARLLNLYGLEIISRQNTKEAA